MGARVGGIQRQRVGGLAHAGVEEVEVLVDPGEAGAAGGAVGVQEQPAAVDGPVVVELDRPVELAQRLDRPVDRLQPDRVVEVGRGVERVELLGQRVLLGGQLLAPLLEVGAAEVGAQQRVAGIEADGELDVAPAGLQVAVADLGEAEPEPRQGGLSGISCAGQG